MALIAKKKQGSSVARNIFSPRHIKSLRAAEEIFLLSVALEAFTSQVGRLCAQTHPCGAAELRIAKVRPDNYFLFKRARDGWPGLFLFRFLRLFQTVWVPRSRAGFARAGLEDVGHSGSGLFFPPSRTSRENGAPFVWEIHAKTEMGKGWATRRKPDRRY